ncbi:MAG TPA: acyl-CoA dehydrogenase family protein [Blastocatellia bacterium]|nr:acyl-CoA dehydrogenase family protein [Blastocatellia bacterium]
MDFDLNETQKLFKSSARELFAQECPPEAVRAMIENGVPYSEALWQKLVEQGWTGLIFDEADGGMGLGYVEMAVAFEEMGHALVPGAFLSTVALAGSLVARAGNPSQRNQYLKAICEGEAKATVALLEAAGDWNPDAVQLQASETATGLTLNGTKLFVADAGAVNTIITVARIGSDLALAVVAADTPGLAIKPMPAIDATRHLYEVAYNNVEVAATQVLARGEAARAAIEQALDVATVALAAEMVGGMQWLLDATVEYAKTRKQFGKPIGQFQAIQHHCANMLLLTESARSAVYYAAWQLGNDAERAPLAVSVAKTYTSDAYREAGNLGIQVHGGIGFTWDEPMHFYYKRAKASELMFGDAAYHRERIARLVIDAAAPVKAAHGSGD